MKAEKFLQNRRSREPVRLLARSDKLREGRKKARAAGKHTSALWPALVYENNAALLFAAAKAATAATTTTTAATTTTTAS